MAYLMQPGSLVFVAILLALAALRLYERATPPLPVVEFDGDMQVIVFGDQEPSAIDVKLYYEGKRRIHLSASVKYDPPSSSKCIRFVIVAHNDARLSELDTLSSVSYTQIDEAHELVLVQEVNGVACFSARITQELQIDILGTVAEDMIEITDQVIVARAPIILAGPIEKATVRWNLSTAAPELYSWYKVETSSPNYVGPGLVWESAQGSGRYMPFATLSNIFEEKLADRLLFAAGLLAGLAFSLVTLAGEQVLRKQP